MKDKFILIISFLIVSNLFLSFGASVWGILTNSYFDDYNNYISLKKPQKYMEIDTFLFKKIEHHTDLNDSPPGKYIFHGVKQGTDTEVEIVIWKKKYFDSTLDKYPVYKSKLTNDYFLKNAPKGYYRRQNRSFFLGIYLKFSLFPLLGLVIYLFREYKKLR